MKEHEKRLIELAGPKAKLILRDAFEYSARTTICSPFVPVKGRGVKVQSIDGEWYLDFTSGVGVSNLGYRPERIYDAVLNQMTTGLTQFLYHDWASHRPAELCRRLAEITPGDFPKKVFLCSSGAEANEAALKLCFAKRPERKRVIAFEGAFHGRTLGVIPLMASKEIHVRNYPLAYKAHHFPFPAQGSDWKNNCVGAMKRQFKKLLPPEEVNVMIMELVQGEGGIIPADPKAVKALIEICREHNILVAIDEIQTGMYRTGKMFASEHYGIEPDIMTLAKALGSGVAPIGAMVFRADLNWDENGRHSTTNGGNLLAAAAARETIEIMLEDGFGDDVKRVSKEISAYLYQLKIAFGWTIVSVRGLGAMWGIEFTDGATRNKVAEECYKRKLIVIGAGESVLRIMPPLTITSDEIAEGMNIITDAIKTVAPPTVPDGVIV